MNINPLIKSHQPLPNVQKHRASPPPIEGGRAEKAEGVCGSYTMNKTRGMQFWKAAMRYYPDFSRSTAVRRFRDEIHNTPELLEELKWLGYDERKRYFPPRQMSVIIKYLGEL